MIVNDTTLHKRPNDTEMNSYRSPFGLQQIENPIPHSQLTHQMDTIRNTYKKNIGCTCTSQQQKDTKYRSRSTRSY